jgi:hypothetical protein
MLEHIGAQIGAGPRRGSRPSQRASSYRQELWQIDTTVAVNVHAAHKFHSLSLTQVAGREDEDQEVGRVRREGGGGWRVERSSLD